MSKIEVILGENARRELGETIKTPISWGTRVGDFIFLAGVAPIDQEWKTVGNTMGEQFERTLQIIQALLQDAGASLNDIVKMTKYVTTEVTMEKVYPEIAQVTKRYFTSGYYPPSTLVEVKSCMMPNQLIEVDVIAFKQRD
jgi:2-iminobutanoate/2-iminopropanoate deaminase